MRMGMMFCLATGLLSLGLTQASATTLEQAKSDGFVRGANANEKPYAFMDADGAAKGIGPEVAAEVWKALGVKDIAWSVTPFGTSFRGSRLAVTISSAPR
jgi:polar amino acid transport system substrate-binding protein